MTACRDPGVLLAAVRSVSSNGAARAGWTRWLFRHPVPDPSHLCVTLLRRPSLDAAFRSVIAAISGRLGVRRFRSAKRSQHPWHSVWGWRRWGRGMPAQLPVAQLAASGVRDSRARWPTACAGLHSDQLWAALATPASRLTPADGRALASLHRVCQSIDRRGGFSSMSGTRLADTCVVWIRQGLSERTQGGDFRHTVREEVGHWIGVLFYNRGL